MKCARGLDITIEPSSSSDINIALTSVDDSVVRYLHDTDIVRVIECVSAEEIAHHIIFQFHGAREQDRTRPLFQSDNLTSFVANDVRWMPRSSEQSDSNP